MRKEPINKQINEVVKKFMVYFITVYFAQNI